MFILLTRRQALAMIADGLYIANAHKTSAGSAEILRAALAAQGVNGAERDRR